MKMTRYYVYEIAKATEENHNFAGETREYIIGKGEWVYGLRDLIWEDRGWKQKRFAEAYITKSIHYDRHDCYWEYTYKIVEVDFKEHQVLYGTEML